MISERELQKIIKVQIIDDVLIIKVMSIFQIKIDKWVFLKGLRLF